MEVKNIKFLKNILGESLTAELLKASEEKTKNIIFLLKHTKIRNILSEKQLQDVCKKIAFGIYGDIFVKAIINIDINNIEDEKEIKKLIIYYNDLGCKYADNYQELLNTNFLKHSTPKTLDLSIMGKKEIEEKDEITVLEFLNNFGSLEELLSILEEYNVTHFNLDLDSKLPIQIINKLKIKDLKIYFYQIALLYANLDKLNLDPVIEEELLETYYNGISTMEKDVFNNCIINLKNKPHLIYYLKYYNPINEKNLTLERKVPKN